MLSVMFYALQLSPYGKNVERLAAHSGPGDHSTEQLRLHRGPLFLMGRSGKLTVRKLLMPMWTTHVL
jgi:hypothetical protein